MGNSNETVVIAMSGGVDSSVAAALLQQQGYNVVGVTMQIWQESTSSTKGAGCCSLGAVEDARRVAAKLDIPHYVLNFKEVFADKVIHNFVEEYKNGRTPNPCVNCNRFIKFDALLEKAHELGAKHLATGHYARIEYSTSAQRWMLRKSIDDAKDQTYALYHFTQFELEHTLMPLGFLSNKAETRSIAASLDLNVSAKPDSQEICFVQGRSYTDFLRDSAPETVQPGAIVDTSGTTRGTHDGIAFYTIGQRKRLNVGSPIPLYVIDINADSNEIIVGSNNDLLACGLIANDLNWIASPGPILNVPIKCKIRYNMTAVSGFIESIGGDGSIKVKFKDAQRAVTPGQSLVVYDDSGEYVLGGGTIKSRVTESVPVNAT